MNRLNLKTFPKISPWLISFSMLVMLLALPSLLLRSLNLPGLSFVSMAATRPTLLA